MGVDYNVGFVLTKPGDSLFLGHMTNATKSSLNNVN
jgi:hypothetical protein